MTELDAKIRAEAIAADLPYEVRYVSLSPHRRSVVYRHGDADAHDKMFDSLRRALEKR